MTRLVHRCEPTGILGVRTADHAGQTLSEFGDYGPRLTVPHLVAVYASDGLYLHCGAANKGFIGDVQLCPLHVPFYYRYV